MEHSRWLDPWRWLPVDHSAKESSAEEGVYEHQEVRRGAGDLENKSLHVLGFRCFATRSTELIFPLR